jgi:chromate transporter
MNETYPSLGEIARLFLKLGTIGFGGPAAHIALMEADVVRRRRWLTREQFLDLLGAVNLIPGPNSTELAILIGHRKAGTRGLIVAGTCFILPAACIVGAIAWAYVRFGALPQADIVLRSIKPVILAVVIQALWSLGRTALKTPVTVAIAAACVVLNAAGLHELAVLLAAGVAGVAAGAIRSPTSTLFSVGIVPLFLFFLKVGSILFGSGYVLLAFLRADLVERWQWLSDAQLLDAVAVGQFTPGPVFTTATFVGYVVAGWSGAVAATIGIFLPAFILSAISAPLVPRMRSSKPVGAFLDGVNAASLALMAVVTFQLARVAVVDLTTVVLAIAAAVVLLKWKVNSAWLVLAAALFGLLSRS